MKTSVLVTPRLSLRAPRDADAYSIFERYASNPEVTRFLSWRTHANIDDTRAFLAFSSAEWIKWPAGPLLIESREDGRLLGSTGLAFESSDIASTGYALSHNEWGFGFATEALTAVVALANSLAVRHLYAQCHPRHTASIRVLERCGFRFNRLLAKHSEFPNLGVPGPQDVSHYVYSPDIS
jgi:[ribosomal protein S5]-alanine N-acetyltransferase